MVLTLKHEITPESIIITILYFLFERDTHFEIDNDSVTTFLKYYYLSYGQISLMSLLEEYKKSPYFRDHFERASSLARYLFPEEFLDQDKNYSVTFIKGC